MIDGNDTVAPDPTPYVNATARPRVDACADCGQPTRGTIRCDACISLEWERLKAADPAWYERHRMYRRQTAGGDT